MAVPTNVFFFFPNYFIIIIIFILRGYWFCTTHPGREYVFFWGDGVVNRGEEGLLVEHTIQNPLFLSPPSRAALQGVPATSSAPVQARDQGGLGEMGAIRAC